MSISKTGQYVQKNIHSGRIHYPRPGTALARNVSARPVGPPHISTVNKTCCARAIFMASLYDLYFRSDWNFLHYRNVGPEIATGLLLGSPARETASPLVGLACFGNLTCILVSCLDKDALVRFFSTSHIHPFMVFIHPCCECLVFPAVRQLPSPEQTRFFPDAVSGQFCFLVVF